MRPAAAVNGRPASAGRRFLTTSFGLVAGKVASLATGFLFWLLAAHAAGAADVGLAAGAISVMMLATQFAVVGAGSSFILNHTRHEAQLSRLLDAAITLVVLTSGAASVLVLLAVANLSARLSTIATDPVFAGLFLAMTVLGTLGILLDHVSVAVNRGGQVLVRNALGGLLTAAPLLVAAFQHQRLGARSLFALWVAGGVLVCAVGAVQLASGLPGYRYRPGLPRLLTRDLLRSGLPNHALTLVERAPNLLLPVIVTEVLSPELNAYWYTAWMMAWAVLVVPVSVGMSLLAQVSREPTALRRGVVLGGQAGLLLGAMAALAVAVLGPRVLGFIGPDYQAAGSAPLRVLLLALLPVLVIQIYYSVCRGAGRLPEALAVGTVTGLASLGVTAGVAGSSGLVGMAWAWIAVQTAAGLWAALRLRTLLGRRAGAAAPTKAPVTTAA